MKRMVVLLVAVVAGLCLPAFGQGFSYQGRLADGSGAVDATIDLRSRVYSSASGGAQVGNTVSLFDVAVVDGLFTVELDYGGGVFASDEPRWIEIEVRASGPGGYEVLGPRQRVLSVPRAEFALESGVAQFADVSAVALDGPFVRLGEGETTTSGLVEGSYFEVTLKAELDGSGQPDSVVTLLDSIVIGQAGVEGGSPLFEIARPWTSSSQWFQLSRSFTPMGDPVVTELTIEVRCVVLDETGREAGEVLWTIPSEFESGFDPYELRRGSDGGLVEVLQIRPDFQFGGFQHRELERQSTVTARGEEASAVPGRLLDVGVSGGAQPTYAFGDALETRSLTTVGAFPSGSSVASVVQSVASLESWFDVFLSSDCLDDLVNEGDCEESPRLVVLDGGATTVVDSSLRNGTVVRGWALLLTGDGLLVEEVAFAY